MTAKKFIRIIGTISGWDLKFERASKKFHFFTGCLGGAQSVKKN